VSIAGVNFGRLIREGFSNFQPVNAESLFYVWQGFRVKKTGWF
jgi:hypothetical protein